MGRYVELIGCTFEFIHRNTGLIDLVACCQYGVCPWQQIYPGHRVVYLTDVARDYHSHVLSAHPEGE